MQAGGTISISNYWDTCIFSLHRLCRNSRFFHHLSSVLLLITGKSGSCLHSVNIMSNVGNCGDGLWKKTQNQTRQDLRSKLPGYMDFPPRAGAGAGVALFYVKNLHFGNTTDFTYLWAIYCKKTLVLVFPLPTSRSILLL